MSFAAAFDRSLVAAEIAHFAGFQPTTVRQCVEDRAGRFAAPTAICPRVATATARYHAAERAHTDAKNAVYDAPLAARAELEALRIEAFAAFIAAGHELDAAGKAARAAGRRVS